ASGARSTLAAGLASPATGPRFLVQGSRGGVRIEGFDIQEAQLKQGSSPLSLGDVWGVDPEASALVTDVPGTAATVVTEPDGSSRTAASLTVPDGSLRTTQPGPAASRQRASLASASLTVP